MPEKVPNNQKRPWRARAKRGKVKTHLGFYETQEEAIKAEEKFAEEWPKARERRGVNQVVPKKVEREDD